MTFQSESGYIGRFAPSPTGDLHFGSLLAAVASFLDARRAGGQWLLRIEDLDPPREVPGSAQSIIEDLANLHMIPDQEVLYQSTRNAAYLEACEILLRQNLAYWCGCSRSEVPRSGIYPGTCRNGLPPGKKPRALRIRTTDQKIGFEDLIQGRVSQRLDIESGDFVIRRADGLFAYQLAVVVDDNFQQVNHIIRGADLLESTGRQIWLQRCLGFQTPQYAHIPVFTDDRGNKLSKRSQSDPMRSMDPSAGLQKALEILGQACVETTAKNGLDPFWKQAIQNWALNRVPRKASIDPAGI